MKKQNSTLHSGKYVMFIMFLMSAFMLTGLTSCSDDDDNNEEPTQANIVGTWQTTYVDVWDKVNGVDDGEGYKGEYTGITITFDDHQNMTMRGTDIDGTPMYAAGTYSITGNKLILNSDGDTSEITITRLTETELILEYSYEEDWEDEHLEGYTRMECKRIR